MVVTVLGQAPRVLPLYARALAAAIPGASLLPSVPGEGSEIPDQTYVLRGVAADPAKLARYSAVCGFPPGTRLPGTYPHVLATPLHLTLLTNGDFPFVPVGLIHIDNRIVQHRAIPLREQIDLSVRATAAQPHPRGSVFSLLTEARIAGETVWESSSTMLRRGRAKTQQRTSSKQSAEGGNPDRAAEDAQGAWAMPRDLGRRYASVSGDRNPIHTHPLLARTLGFRGAIAHGMWTKARALAVLAGELGETYGVEASFRRPIVLPASVRLSTRDGDGETEFAVHQAEIGTPYLRGRLWPTGATRAGAGPTVAA